MRSNYKIYDNQSIYFVTSTIIEHIPIFLNENMFRIIIDSLVHCQTEKGLKIFAYVVMDNHIHLIVSNPKLSDVLRDFKRHTARKIISLVQSNSSNWLSYQFEFRKKKYKDKSNYQVWQEGFHPQQILNSDMFIQKIEYIHYNPVKRGFVDMPEHWKYSSARNFIGDESIIRLDRIELL
jgi:putative transposase